mmetsp:Transcript_29371/g.61798  ORF Transcript_29371/g.61798 Transcript_29371/m.61798 type:complete len:101 (+) Transcript_29371:364-666(+)
MTSLLGTLGRMERNTTNYFDSSLAAKIQQLLLQRRSNVQTLKWTHSSVGFATFGVRLGCLGRIAQSMNKCVKCKVAELASAKEVDVERNVPHALSAVAHV